MDCDNVWDGFFLFALLVDCATASESQILEVPHHATSQAKRLHEAMERRNRRMAGPGQDMWSHVCDKCAWIFEAKDGQLSAYSMS
jgi:hypothetical protein